MHKAETSPIEPVAISSPRPFVFQTVQEINHLPETVFPFFSRAENLESITPSWLNFRIITPSPIDMKAGTRIVYRLRLYGVPLRWTTEITVWDPPCRFVDEQISGPYNLWHHEHLFVETDGRTRMTDTVHYDFSGGAFRQAVNRLFVAPNVRKIFDFRRSQIRHIFEVNIPKEPDHV